MIEFGSHVARRAKVFYAAMVVSGMLLAPAISQAQVGKKVMLVCTGSGMTLNLTINYAANTVAISGMPDFQGRAAQPARVSASQIDWQAHYVDAASITNYDLSRLTGNLTMSGNNGAPPRTLNCAVGAAKF